MMETILITNNPRIAADCEAAGVSRIMIDLESIGKKERQASRNTFISAHKKEDISLVRAVLKNAALIVRINPWHEHSQAEIDYASAHGADIIMLPMVTDVAQVAACARAIAGRAKFMPLVETAYSMQHLGEIAARADVDEIYIGLNDLHLSLGQEFLFEPLADGLLDGMEAVIKSCGKAFGFGGIARMGSGELPAERILAEHARLGSSRVILSSRFCKDVDIDAADGRKERLVQALAEMNGELERLGGRSPEQRQKDFVETSAIIRRIVAELKLKRRKA